MKKDNNLNKIKTLVSTFSNEKLEGIQMQHANDIFSEIGGKGQNLTKLSMVDLKVPGGYCISYKSFDYYIQTGKLPDGLINAIFLMKKELGGKIALRSSGNIEDGKMVSAAGVFETAYIYDDDKIETELIAIYENAKQDIAKLYFEERGEYEKIRLALVVQELIDVPDMPGVVLSGDTTKDEITVVEYVNGFGNKLVDSQEIGNQIILDKNGETLSERKYEHIIDDMMNDDIIKKIESAIVSAKEVVKSSKVDIEFAVKDAIFYVLQARPLTIELQKDTEVLAGNNTSLSVIQAGNVIEDAYLCIEDAYKNIKDMIKDIESYKQSGNKIILVSKQPSLALDQAIIRADGMIMGSSGVASHGALRAAEYGIPTIGGAKTDNLRNGEQATLNVNNFSLQNKNGSELLIPLHMEKKTNQELINQHNKFVQNHIVERDKEQDTIEGAYERIQNQLKNHLEQDEYLVIMEIINSNIPQRQDIKRLYKEEGYDSCQARRLFSKIVAQAILVGGIEYEGTILGVEETTKNKLIQEILDGLVFNIENIEHKKTLHTIAKKYGKNQEFIFPGIIGVPGTDTIEENIKNTINGNLKTSVRTISGVGGLRNDKERNHTTNFKKFLELKMIEDKRYYPGMALLYFLIRMTQSQQEAIPLLQKFKRLDTKNYNNFIKLIALVQNQKEQDYENIAILCALDLTESKPYAFEKAQKGTNLFRAFHSPAYELSTLKDLFEGIIKGEYSKEGVKSIIEELKFEVNSLKTFNSTIHLPRADEISGLSHRLIGQLKNKYNEYAIRYGIGRENTAGEVVETIDKIGNKNYIIKVYDNKLFEGQPIEKNYLSEEDFKEIEIIGFINFIMKKLGAKKGKK